MQFQSLLAFLTIVFSLEMITVNGRLFCYRRLKKRGKCGGLLRKTRYSSHEECCAHKGQGFSDKKVKLGRNRFRCSPCSDLEQKPKTAAPTLPTQSPSTDPPVTKRQPVRTTTSFSWPKPRNKYSQSRQSYSSGGDNRPVVEWEKWSPCSVSCGAGWRSRAIVCDDCDRNDYENVQSQPCMVNFYCPVDGNWGPWYPWESCSTTCDSGTRTRNRKCNYPPPAYGGARCAEDAVATQECTKKSCPVNGGWSEWNNFTSCSVTCGPGTIRKTRSCDSPYPEHGGKDCQGSDSVVKKCELVKCPVKGGWSLWSSFSMCSATCGHGVKQRSRSCDSPRPQHGGEECAGAASNHQQCYGGRTCPVHGGWSAWTNYDYCRAPRCGQGYQIRSRSCTKPRPAHGGRPCTGQQYERVSCRNDQDCPRNGTWCEWTQWNQCSSTCQENAPLQARQRICACPKPKNGGSECKGESFKVQECKDVPVCNMEDFLEEISGYSDVDDDETDANAEITSSQGGVVNSSFSSTATTPYIRYITPSTNGSDNNNISESGILSEKQGQLMTQHDNDVTHINTDKDNQVQTNNTAYT